MFQHTGMKAIVFKQKIFPVSERLERPLYILAASITYYWTFTKQIPLPALIWNFEKTDESGWLVFIVAFFCTLGIFITLRSTHLLDHWSFCGITQAHAN